MAIEKLNLQNENNKLQCDAFTQIHFAPQINIKESDLHKVFIIAVNGEEVFVELVDMVKILFKNVGSVITLPATGMQGKEWKEAWKKKYPTTNNDTVMAVYMYKRAMIDVDPSK